MESLTAPWPAQPAARGSCAGRPRGGGSMRRPTPTPRRDATRLRGLQPPGTGHQSASQRPAPHNLRPAPGHAS
eukprot:11180637-Lingulodinium_polyedra.AAC.1